MASEHILIVEDDEDIQELVRYNLAKEGYTLTCVASGEGALDAVKTKAIDLVVLDLMLPGIDGLDVCRSIRAQPVSRDIPIVMLTAKTEEADMVLGLELGADDYMTKPFSPRVLVARMRAVLRRKAAPMPDQDDSLTFGDLVMHPCRHEVLIHGESVDLSSTEFKILHFLARHPGWVFTRDQLITAVHGKDYPVTDRSVDVQIVGLRKKLGKAGEYIGTVRGVGYRFKEQA